MNFFSIATRIGAVFGALVLLIGVSSAKGAPQEAASAGVAIALGVLPYVSYRVLQISREAEERSVQSAEVLKRLDTLIQAQQTQ